LKGVKPHLKRDPDAVRAVPTPPSWLSKEAKAEWRRVMPLLIERKILTDADMGSVENYCVAIGQVRQMERTLATDGHVIETTRGLRAHPAAKLQADAMTRARLLAAELGLTPVSRSRPSIRDDNDDEDSSALGL
jgi:P27 family predicted phage terminase small subunit